ncbi:unnamed protein product [Ambrosiozyma monospora]|uniref:Unnamed protein product n=1 Tax=Ambrosiozyma monospora TaxID=43982 RepID=A0ACB5T806_AMBMO|nr:unnamed protein product [Ambrosiozyma monospora]
MGKIENPSVLVLVLDMLAFEYKGSGVSVVVMVVADVAFGTDTVTVFDTVIVGHNWPWTDVVVLFFEQSFCFEFCLRTRWFHQRIDCLHFETDFEVIHMDESFVFDRRKLGTNHVNKQLNGKLEWIMLLSI